MSASSAVDAHSRAESVHRFQALEAKETLFVQSASANSLEPMVAKRIASSLADLMSGEGVVLLGRGAKIEAFFDPNAIDGLRIEDISSVRTIVFSAKLGRKIARWKRGQSVQHGVWLVHDFQFARNAQVPWTRWLFRSLLDPWADEPTGRKQGARTRRTPSRVESRGDDPVSRAIAIREALTESVPMIDANGWGKWRGNVGINPSAALGKQKQNGNLFAVRVGREDRYPEFQFNKDGVPLPGMSTVLVEVPPDARDWSLLSWFDAPSSLLGGRKPSELVATDPERVAKAARAFYTRDD